MSMDKVIGHNSAKQLLRAAAAAGRINHAYIFEGAEGVGRLSLAKGFAEEIAGDSDRFTADSHPDIIIVRNELYNPSKTSKNVLVDTIRSMKADVYIRPYKSDRKIYIIPNADSMLAEAQNSLLKVFEEPPEYCIIILIAKNANALLQTIRSRAQLVRLHNLGFSEVAEYLTLHGKADRNRADALAVLSGGSIGKALLLTDDDEAIQRREDVIGHLMKLTDSGVVPLYDFIKYLKKNKSDIAAILDIISSWSNDVLYIKTGVADACGISNADKKTEINKFCSSVTRQAAIRFAEICTKYSLAINRNVNYPIAVQCMATEYWEEIHGRSYRSAF